MNRSFSQFMVENQMVFKLSWSWLFFSDTSLHVSGDGKLGGILEPNPGRCYKDDMDYYKYDYPSLSQINYLANQQKVNIIFAILSRGGTYFPFYNELPNVIENSRFAELSKTENVIELIKDNYKVIIFYNSNC